MANDGDVLFWIVQMWCIPVAAWREKLSPDVECRGEKMRYQNQPVLDEWQLCVWQADAHLGYRAVAGAPCVKGKIVQAVTVKCEVCLWGVCVLLCFIEPVVGGMGRGLLIKGLLTWGFRPIHTLKLPP